MGVYINGMEMPRTHPITVEIYPDGTVLSKTVGRMDIHGKAVPVPPHGRLIDADAVIDLVMQYCPDDDGVCSKAGADLRELLDEIENMPTVIPASEEDE